MTDDCNGVEADGREVEIVSLTKERVAKAVFGKNK